MNIPPDRYGVKRTTGDVVATISWPMKVENNDWFSLPEDVRNKVRDLLDAAVDAVEETRRR